MNAALMEFLWDKWGFPTTYISTESKKDNGMAMPILAATWLSTYNQPYTGYGKTMTSLLSV